MQMSKEEIIRSYKGARDKKKQIGILAELNACAKSQIVDILKEGGLHPGYSRGTKVEKIEPKKPKKKIQETDKGQQDEAGQQAVTKRQQLAKAEKTPTIKETKLDIEDSEELTFIMDKSIEPKIKKYEEKIQELEKEINEHEKKIREIKHRITFTHGQKAKLEEIYKAIASYIG